MDLSKYFGKYVRVDLINGFYYLGLVQNADKDSIELKDKNNKLVSVRQEAISFIREASF